VLNHCCCHLFLFYDAAGTRQATETYTRAFTTLACCRSCWTKAKNTCLFLTLTTLEPPSTSVSFIMWCLTILCTYWTTGFWPPSAIVVSTEPFLHGTLTLNYTCSRKWRLADTDLCPCSETQTMSHIVESCPLTKLNGGLSLGCTLQMETLFPGRPRIREEDWTYVVWWCKCWGMGLVALNTGGYINLEHCTLLLLWITLTSSGTWSWTRTWTFNFNLDLKVERELKLVSWTCSWRTVC